MRAVYSANLFPQRQWIGREGMKNFQVLGVTQISDSYPNIKYKLVALQRLLGDTYSEYVILANRSAAAKGFFSALSSGSLTLIWRFLIGHIKVFFFSIRHRAESVYVCYPGIVIAVWLGFPFIRKRYPVVFLDAFISFYDTVVMDRKILKENGVLARILYLLEKRAFEAATVVIVDTPENASHYSKLFGIPSHKFHAMPLCIPPLSTEIAKPKEHTSRRVRCVFVGTLVPLQGIRTIVDAAGLLEGDPEIDFVCIGDGQDAEYLERYLAKTPNARLTWHRGHHSTDFIVEQIRDADICLGIFGDSPKAQRVLPYKIYYYLTLGMPIVTATTETTTRILAECQSREIDRPFLLVPTGDPQSLANAITRLKDNPNERAELGTAGADYFHSVLSGSAIDKSLQELIEPV
jgi:glycosyltransferase involved in cell wall biosynthesis